MNIHLKYTNDYICGTSAIGQNSVGDTDVGLISNHEKGCTMGGKPWEGKGRMGERDDVQKGGMVNLLVSSKFLYASDLHGERLDLV